MTIPILPGSASPLPLALLSLGLLVFPGCSHRDTADADPREIQLTGDAEWNSRPRFSPDGSAIAFSRRDQDGTFTICTMPSTGGDATPLTPKGESKIALSWAAAGDGMYALVLPGQAVQRLAADGSVLQEYDRIPLAAVVDISQEGGRILYARFQGDNYDLCLFDTKTQSLTTLTDTPAWEVDGCFGPEDGELTVVVKDGIAAVDAEIGILSLATGTFQPLPLGKHPLESPAWSSDRNYLLYTSSQAGSKDVWILDRRSGETLQVTSGPEDDVSPSWAPGDDRIAFARRTSFSNVFVEDLASGKSIQLTTGQGRDSSARLSEDGRWVAFLHKPGPEEESDGEALLSVVSAAGGPVTRLDRGGLRPAGSDFAFCWSPDADQLAFVAEDGTGETDIYRVPRTGGHPIQVTLGAGSELAPSWSPDGNTLAFTWVHGGETQVWTIPATGGNPTRISFQDNLCQLGVWSDDSEQLAYLSVQPDGGYSTWIAPVHDPRRARKVFESRRQTGPLHWSEDGKELLLWRTAEDVRFEIWAVPVVGGEPYLVARPEGGEGAAMHRLDFTERGEIHRGRLYPAGKFPYEDGERVSEIYLLRVRELLDRRFGSRGPSAS